MNLGCISKTSLAELVFYVIFIIGMVVGVRQLGGIMAVDLGQESISKRLWRMLGG